MSTQLQFRRNDGTSLNSIIGLEGEIFVDTDDNSLRVHDGTTPGGTVIPTKEYVDTNNGTAEIEIKVDSGALSVFNTESDSQTFTLNQKENTTIRIDHATVALDNGQFSVFLGSSTNSIIKTIDIDSYGHIKDIDFIDLGTNAIPVSFGKDNSIASIASTTSCAFGTNNVVNVRAAVAIGRGNEVNEQGGIAIGDGNTVDGQDASAFGHINEASATYSSAIGYRNIASETNSSAFGYRNTATKPNSSAFGYSVDVDAENVQEFGKWDGSSREAAIRLHDTGMAALTIENNATAYFASTATNGAEANGELANGMFAFRRNGDEVLIDLNIGGVIKTLSLGTAT